MRKIISLGLLAATILSFSTQVLAGYPQCDGEDGSLKPFLQSLKLYGLCNAYWDNEGDPETQDAILTKFRERAPDGVDMPGLASCPCWGDHELLLATCNYLLTDPDDEGDSFRAWFDGGKVQFTATGSLCIYLNSYTGATAFAPTDESEDIACKAGIVSLIYDDLADMCPYP